MGLSFQMNQTDCLFEGNLGMDTGGYIDAVVVVAADVAHAVE